MLSFEKRLLIFRKLLQVFPTVLILAIKICSFYPFALFLSLTYPRLFTHIRPLFQVSLTNTMCHFLYLCVSPDTHTCEKVNEFSFLENTAANEGRLSCKTQSTKIDVPPFKLCI